MLRGTCLCPNLCESSRSLNLALQHFIQCAAFPLRVALLTASCVQFSLFDLDRDRHLDYHELRVALRALGFQLPKPELVHLLTTHGVPRPQSSQPLSRQPHSQSQPTHPSQLLIPHSAFQQLAARKILERDPREEIDRAFDLFDADGKGWISLD